MFDHLLNTVMMMMVAFLLVAGGAGRRGRRPPVSAVVHLMHMVKGMVIMMMAGLMVMAATVDRVVHGVALRRMMEQRAVIRGARAVRGGVRRRGTVGVRRADGTARHPLLDVLLVQQLVEELAVVVPGVRGRRALRLVVVVVRPRVAIVRSVMGQQVRDSMHLDRRSRQALIY